MRERGRCCCCSCYSLRPSFKELAADLQALVGKKCSAAAAKREADGKKYDVFFDDGQTEQSVKREEFLPGRRLLPKQAVCVRFEDDVTYYGRIVRRVGRDFPARYIVRFKNGDMQEGLVESEVLPGHRR